MLIAIKLIARGLKRTAIKWWEEAFSVFHREERNTKTNLKMKTSVASL